MKLFKNDFDSLKLRKNVLKEAIYLQETSNLCNLLSEDYCSLKKLNI